MDFLSLNVRGIRDAIKRMSLMQWLSHHRLDIVCLQETHAVSASESSAWFLPFGFLTVSAVGSARARGLAILYRPRLILNQSWVELCGRFSMAEFMNGNFLFRVVCIYAPNTNPECNPFLLSCADLIDPTIPTLLCRDFNAIWDRIKDRRGSSNDSSYRDCSASLHYLFSEACVFDVWRYLHLDTIAFSWMRRDGLLASRINLFGSPLSWAHGVHTGDFVPCSYSDHAAVVLRVSPPVQLFRGPGRWKLNSSIFRDPDFSSIIESFWASWRRRKKDFRSIQLWWDRGKEGISSAICINGYTSAAFFPSGGVRQGCPLSPLLYVLSIEVLATNLRASRAIPGLRLPHVSTPLPVVSLYADDTTVIALSDTAILEVFRVYARFEAGTGSKLNLSKCEGLWSGPWRFRTNPPVDIRWSSSRVKILGVFISYDEMGEVNWRPRVEGFCRCIDAWRSRALSFSGRAVILNSLAPSKIWYVASVIAMPKSVLKELNTRIFNFFLGR